MNSLSATLWYVQKSRCVSHWNIFTSWVVKIFPLKITKFIHYKNQHWTRTLSSFSHFSSSCLRPCCRTGLHSSRDSNLLSWPWSNRMPKYWSRGDVWPGCAGTLWKRRIVSGVRRMPWKKRVNKVSKWVTVGRLELRRVTFEPAQKKGCAQWHWVTISDCSEQNSCNELLIETSQTKKRIYSERIHPAVNVSCWF